MRNQASKRRARKKRISGWRGLHQTWHQSQEPTQWKEWDAHKLSSDFHGISPHARMHTHSNLRVPKEEEGTERISEELRLYASQIYEIQLSTLPRDYQTPSWKEQHVGTQRANMSTQMTMKSLPGEWSKLCNMQTQGCSHAAGWTQTAKRGNTNGAHFKTKYLLWNYLLLGPWVKQIN